jgi:hypothetical protein
LMDFAGCYVWMSWVFDALQFVHITRHTGLLQSRSYRDTKTQLLP